MKKYFIEDVYIIESMVTLVLSSYSGENAIVWGEFQLNLLNADEVELNTVSDSRLIELIKEKEIFFGEISLEYYNIINQAHNTDSALGMIIVES